MKAIPYLYFAGDCAKALEFYRDAIGADIRALVRFGDMPGALSDANEKVLHAELRVGDSTVFASDGQAAERPSDCMLRFMAHPPRVGSLPVLYDRGSSRSHAGI